MPTASDYLQRLRGRLLLDWDDPLFSGPLFMGEQGAARKKLIDLASPRSEDAITWSVFRTLAQIHPESWLPAILNHVARAEGTAGSPLYMEFWREVAPPAARLLWMLDHLDTLAFFDPLRQQQAGQRLERVRKSRERWKAQVAAGPSERGDGIFEGPTEIDVVLITPAVLVVIEGKAAHDIPVSTPWDPHRDQVARCLDAALELAGPQRRPYALLITDDYVHEGPDTLPKAYEALLPRYRDDPAFRAARLPHRSAAELARLDGHIGWVSWADMVDIALDNSAALSPEQKRLLRDLVDYLRSKRLLHKGG